VRTNILLRQKGHDKVVELSPMVLQKAKAQNDTSGLIFANMTLGNQANALNKSEEAKKYYGEALTWMATSYWRSKYFQVYNNLAIYRYKLDNEGDSVFKYLDLGLKYGPAKQNIAQLANTYIIYGGMLSE
jgi:tetratricopeptide (TPR) repeat protein